MQLSFTIFMYDKGVCTMSNKNLLIKENLCIMSKSKKLFRNIKPLLKVAIPFILLSLSVFAKAEKLISPLSVEDVKALIPQIESVETSLSNIKIESELWGETKTNLSDPCEPWKRTPIYISSTAWFKYPPSTKGRVDVHKHVLEWQEGIAQYINESYSLGFDGHYGRTANHTFGHSGTTYSSKKGEILTDAPKNLGTSWCNTFTGRRFSLHFFFNNDLEISSFSKFLREVTSVNVVKHNAFEFNLVEFQGAECVKIDSILDRNIAHVTYWLDVSHGFALRGYELVNVHKDGSELLVSRITVSKLKEVEAGLWWPIEAFAESGPLKPENTYKRLVYRTLNVVANNPNFNENVFTIDFPNGYLIDDQITGKRYRVGEDPNAPENQ